MDSNFGYIFTTDCTDYTDFSSQEATIARGDDGRMQNNPNGRSRRGSKIRIIRAIRCGKNTSET